MGLAGQLETSDSELPPASIEHDILTFEVVAAFESEKPSQDLSEPSGSWTSQYAAPLPLPDELELHAATATPAATTPASAATARSARPRALPLRLKRDSGNTEELASLEPIEFIG
jgi:hypothetical protein